MFVGNNINVGTAGLKITHNQLCIENSSADLYLNNAALGTGNVLLGKPHGGAVTIMRRSESRQQADYWK